MNRRLTILAITVLVVGAVVSVVLMAPAPATAGGAEQIRGTAIDGSGDCNPEEDDVPVPLPIFPLYFPPEDGGIHGCLYSYPTSSEVTPGGTIRERGYEIFVSHDDPTRDSRFETTYQYTAKFDEDGNQMYGRCQHPIVAGSGKGDFEGVTGRFNIKDNIVNGVAVDFPYKGHLRW